MARSKAKSRKTREPSDSNSTGDGQQNGNNNNLHKSRLCRESTNPQRSLSRALNIRDQEKNRPMTSEEMKASKYKHFRPYEPSTTPQTLVTHERGRIRMEFPRRRNSSSSSFNPYDRWTENAAVDEVIELDTPPPPPSKSKPGRRGRKPGPKAGGATGSRMTPMSGTQGRLSYTLLGVAKENPLDRPRQMIYGVAFNNWVGETVDIFATVGDATVTVYRAGKDVKGGFEALASYYAQGEIFYSCDWTRALKENTNILIFAGDSGHIRMIIFHAHGGQEQVVLGSHPHAVNDVKVDRKDFELVATGAADHSLRLWNVEKRILIAIFGGAEGPRNQVVSVSFHDFYPILAGTGIDHTIHFWDLGTEALTSVIAASKVYTKHPYTFEAVLQHMPKWVTRDIHSNFIDCISFWGDWLVTRSVNEEIILWRCGRDGEHILDLKYEIFSENLNAPVNDWQEQEPPVPRRLTGRSEIEFTPYFDDRERKKQQKQLQLQKMDKMSKEEEGPKSSRSSSVNTRTRSTSVKSRDEEDKAGRRKSRSTSTVTRTVDNKSKEPDGKKTPSRRSTSTTALDSKSAKTSAKEKRSSSAVRGDNKIGRKSTKADDTKPSSSKPTRKSATNLTTTITKVESQKPGSKQPKASSTVNGNQDEEISSSLNTKAREQPKASKINIGPDVQICKRFAVAKSSSWFLRFGLDYEHKLLGFGNEVGDYSVFYLGQWRDQALGDELAFKQVRELKIPVYPDIKGCFVRQVAFNYTGQLMVGVTDRCHVTLYRLTVNDPKVGPGEGNKALGRIFAKANANSRVPQGSSEVSSSTSASTSNQSSVAIASYLSEDEDNSSDSS